MTGTGITRYRFSKCKLHFDPHVCLCGGLAHKDGDWVKHADHLSAIEALSEALKESQEALQKIAAVHPCAGTYEQDAHKRVLAALEHGRKATKHITDKEAELGDGSERNIRLDAK